MSAEYLKNSLKIFVGLIVFYIGLTGFIWLLINHIIIAAILVMIFLSLIFGELITDKKGNEW